MKKDQHCGTCVFHLQTQYCRLLKRVKWYQDGASCKHYIEKKEDYESPYL